MPIKVNLAGVQTGFTALPAGSYECYVSDGEMREGKESGKPYIAWTLTVDGGEFDGRKLFHNTSLAENALFGVKGLLAATERWTDADLDQDDFEFEIEDVIGAKVRARVTVEKYQGDDTNRIKSLRPVSGAEKEDAGSLLP